MLAVDAHFDALEAGAESSGDWQRALHGLHGSSIEQCNAMARQAALRAARFSSAPISKFAVGAAVVDVEGRIFHGANVEFPGLPLAASVHAEQAAVAMAVSAHAAPLVAIAVTAMPCGHCRQFLTELHDAASLRILVGESTEHSLATLYPESFSPAELGRDARLLAPHAASAAIAKSSSAADRTPGQSLQDAARAMLLNAHVPYSGYRSAVALGDDAGRMIVAPSIESVAYNPSMTAMQSACAVLLATGGRFENLTDALFADAEHDTMDHLAASALLLRAVSDVELRRDVA